MTTTKPSTQPVRDLAALEQRRLKSARRFAAGATQAQVACEFGVSAQTASRWQRAWRAGGRAALRTPERFGRPARLTDAQWRTIEDDLLAGALAHGYDQQGWTLGRVREVIARRTGITYHPAHVWALLRKAGWTLQRPARRAAERDDAAVATWVKTAWPDVTGGEGAREVDRLL